MAKKKEIKPIPLAAAIVMFIVAFALMAIFIAYIVSAGGNDSLSYEDSLGGQSFTEESSVEPPPPEVVEIKETMADANVGDVVLFGSYEQNAVENDGKEPIEWVVLKKDETSLMLISRYALACRQYNGVRESVSWTGSDLFAWLNDGFYYTAFDETEMANMLTVEVRADGEEASYSASYNVTMLTSAEAVEFFEYDSWRIASATPAAVAEGARVEDGNCWWWLCGSLFDGESKAQYVHFNGAIQEIGFAVDYDKVAVRPVIWVSADAEKETSGSSESEISE